MSNYEGIAQSVMAKIEAEAEAVRRRQEQEESDRLSRRETTKAIFMRYLQEELLRMRNACRKHNLEMDISEFRDTQGGSEVSVTIKQNAFMCGGPDGYWYKSSPAYVGALDDKFMWWGIAGETSRNTFDSSEVDANMSAMFEALMKSFDRGRSKFTR